MFKKRLLTLLLMPAISFAATEYTSFHQVANAIADGNRLSYTITMKKCHSSQSLLDNVLTISPDTVMNVQGNKITASLNHFSLDDPLVYGPANEYIKVELTRNGRATIDTTVLRSPSLTEVFSYRMECSLNSGLKITS